MIDPISMLIWILFADHIIALERYHARAEAIGFSPERAAEILSEEMKITESTARSALEAIEIASRRLSVEESA